MYKVVNTEMINLYWNIGKIEKVRHKNIGQLQMYVNYYDRKIIKKDENKMIGIVLFTDKNEKVVK